jgi:hypothetical protein
MKIYIKVLFILNILFVSSLNATVKDDDSLMNEGLKANTKKEYKESFKIFQQLAQKEYAKPQYYLSIAYELGQGVTQDSKKALFWLKSAVKLGDERATVLLAQKYYNGWNIPVDKSKAKELLERAKKSGNPQAKFLWKQYQFDNK